MHNLVSLCRARVVRPLLQLLRSGATPQKLAWALAVGIVVGINPLLGSTTLLALLLASVLRVNLVASQLACHLTYPLELLLWPVFIHVGDRVFGMGPMPLAPAAMLDALRRHPLATTHRLWQWEWHALVVWAALAVVLLPVLGFGLRPLIGRLQRRSEAAHAGVIAA